MPHPDEKARAWTRPDDYWPPRRPARSGRAPPRRGRRNDGDRGDPVEDARPWLGIVPYALLMLSMGVLAVAIMVAAWPGRRAAVQRPPAAAPVASEVGTAPSGWLDTRS